MFSNCRFALNHHEATLMTPKPSIVLLETDSSAIHEISKVVSDFKGSVGTLTTAVSLKDGIDILKASEPHILFLAVNNVEQGVKEVAFLTAQFPRTTVIVTAAEKNPDWILQLIRAGAGEYLTKPVNAEELIAAIQRVVRLHQPDVKPVKNNGTVISVYNPAGGMGTTTIAVNLAASMASPSEQVVLVDLNLCCGDITSFLDLAPRYTIASVTARQGSIDANFIKSVIVRHSSGLNILCAPQDVSEADKIKPQQLHEVISVLKTIYTYIVIDTGGQLFDCNLATFECSDLIMYVTLLNLPALKNAKRYLTAIHNEVAGVDKVRLIINRHNPRDDIRVADAEKVLNTKVYLTIPNGFHDVKTSINKGVPLTQCNPGSQVGKALDELARKIAMEPTVGGKAVVQPNSQCMQSGKRGDLAWHSPINLQQTTM